MNLAEQLRQRLATLEPVSLDLIDESSQHAGHSGWREGGGTHWRLAIVSPRFAGQSPVARHRMVYQALGELMQNPIHALAITAQTPEEQESKQMKMRILVAALLAMPLATAAQLPTKEPAKKEAAPKKDAAKGAAPIATVNGVAVPRARADALMNQQKARGAPDNDQLRSQIREELVNREVLMQEAQKSGVARSPEVASQLDLARQEIIISAFLRDWVRKHPVSDADVQKEYERVKAEQGDKEYRARHILVETEDQAKTMVAELKKGGKFEDLAAKNSKDPGSKDRGGDLDWHGPGDFDRAFSDAMMKLEKGKFTETPVRTRFGFHIIQLDDVRTGRFPSLAEVKPRIQQQLTQVRIDELVKGLRGKAKIE